MRFLAVPCFDVREDGVLFINELYEDGYAQVVTATNPTDAIS